MRGSAVILTHPRKQRGEAKGRSTMADLYSWQPSCWLIIREGEDWEDGGNGNKDGEVEDERPRGEKAIELWIQRVSLCFHVSWVCLWVFLYHQGKEWLERAFSFQLLKNMDSVFVHFYLKVSLFVFMQIWLFASLCPHTYLCALQHGLVLCSLFALT